jgi:hypothetical protein
VFTAVDEDGRPVVVRTIAGPLTDEQRASLLMTFRSVCAAPLDHPGILRPLASGLQGETPYIVHEWGAGESLEARLTRDGVQPLETLLPLLTRVAAAVDFAAAAGVHHGALSAGDIYIRDDHAAVAAFGVAQALGAAGVAVDATHDVDALARLAYAALGEAPLRVDVPESALALIAGLQQEHAQTPSERLGRLEPAPSAVEDEVAPMMPVPPVPPATPVSAVTPMPPVNVREGWPASRGVALVLVALGIGIGAGYLARDVIDPERVVVAPPSGPTATTGHEQPDVAGQVPAREQVPARDDVPGASARAEPRREATRPAERPAGEVPRPAAAGTADIEVLSRPSGAQVFIDGELVGMTPLERAVTAGAHAIRLDLPGHRPWVTRVEARPGEPLRVAGSLER